MEGWRRTGGVSGCLSAISGNSASQLLQVPERSRQPRQRHAPAAQPILLLPRRRHLPRQEPRRRPLLLRRSLLRHCSTTYGWAGRRATWVPARGTQFTHHAACIAPHSPRWERLEHRQRAWETQGGASEGVRGGGGARQGSLVAWSSCELTLGAPQGRQHARHGRQIRLSQIKHPPGSKGARASPKWVAGHVPNRSGACAARGRRQAARGGQARGRCSRPRHRACAVQN